MIRCIFIPFCTCFITYLLLYHNLHTQSCHLVFNKFQRRCYKAISRNSITLSRQNREKRISGPSEIVQTSLVPTAKMAGVLHLPFCTFVISNFVFYLNVSFSDCRSPSTCFLTSSRDSSLGSHIRKRSSNSRLIILILPAISTYFSKSPPSIACL